jgi:hypothetical protein
MNDAVPTSGKIMLASLADAAALESKTSSVATVAATPNLPVARNLRVAPEELVIIDSIINYVNP